MRVQYQFQSVSDIVRSKLVSSVRLMQCPRCDNWILDSGMWDMSCLSGTNIWCAPHRAAYWMKGRWT
jgi:hypothetical protein